VKEMLDEKKVLIAFAVLEFIVIAVVVLGRF
jgi:hypothetical protein